MKKEYSRPQTYVVRTEPAQILCMSGGMDGDGRPAETREDLFDFGEETFSGNSLNSSSQLW